MTMFRRLKHMLALTLTTLVMGCGGGLAVGIDLGYAGLYYEDIDQRPTVSLAVSTDLARHGDVVRLVAAANDDHFVDNVTFFSVNRQGVAFPLVTLRSPPYTIDALITANADGIVYFMARATDDYGQYGDSALVGVRVVP